MLAELNDMIEQPRAAASPYDFDGFMQRHGEFFPGNPQTLDELLEQMARRMAAMSRLLASMSPEQRAELQALAEQVLQDMDLAFEVDRLGANLAGGVSPRCRGASRRMARRRGRRCRCRRRSTRWSACTTTRTSTGRCGATTPGASLEDVDEDALRRTLGEDAVRDLRRLKEIERALERAGLVTRDGGRLEVTPRGARKLGERALVQVFEQLRRDREGAHDARAGRRPGRAHRRDPAVAVRRHRADRRAAQRVQRGRARRGPSGRACGCTPDDFELVEAEPRTEAATALLLDLSFSMPLRGHWVPRSGWRSRCTR